MSGHETRPIPKTGPFYWFPSPMEGSPSWTVLAAHDFGLDDDSGHVDLWPYVLTTIAATWGREAASLKRRLGLYYTGLPRGRITRMQGVYLVLHGDDAPIPDWGGQVIDHFRLSGRRVKILFDEHETQIPGDPEVFAATLGVSSLPARH